MGTPWLLYAFGDERQYSGNEAYDDEVTSVYRYGGRVPNRKRLREGDTVVVCDQAAVVGMATIARIVEERGVSEQLRCPVSGCGDTSIKQRKHAYPSFRCGAGHTFDEPAREPVTETTYAAHFADSFRPARANVSRAVARAYSLSPGAQLAIRPLDPSRFSRLLASLDLGAPQLRPGDADRTEAGGYEPGLEDLRRSALRQIRMRRGQQAFRNTQRARFGDRCVVSGCGVVDLLEAAHIAPYRGDDDNHSDNGLLLRADLHTPFDLGLLAIDPDSLRVRIHSTVEDETYRRLDGIPLRPPATGEVSIEALRARWQRFRV